MKKMIFSALVMLFSMFAFQTNAQVKIGDIMEKSGTKGIVVYVDESGQHGLLMTVQAATKKQVLWADESYASEKTGANDENDGEKNTQTVVNYAKGKGLNLSEAFPLFDWAVNTCGEGWYIPASNELITMANGITRNQLKGFSPKNKNIVQIQKTLQKNKGYSLIGPADLLNWISSSTECTGEVNQCVALMSAPEKVLSKTSNIMLISSKKTNKTMVAGRAFCKF